MKPDVQMWLWQPQTTIHQNGHLGKYIVDLYDHHWGPVLPVNVCSPVPLDRVTPTAFLLLSRSVTYTTKYPLATAHSIRYSSVDRWLVGWLVDDGDGLRAFGGGAIGGGRT